MFRVSKTQKSIQPIEDLKLWSRGNSWIKSRVLLLNRFFTRLSKRYEVCDAQTRWKNFTFVFFLVQKNSGVVLKRNSFILSWFYIPWSSWGVTMDYWKRYSYNVVRINIDKEMFGVWVGHVNIWLHELQLASQVWFKNKQEFNLCFPSRLRATM